VQGEGGILIQGTRCTLIAVITCLPSIDAYSWETAAGRLFGGWEESSVFLILSVIPFFSFRMYNRAPQGVHPTVLPKASTEKNHNGIKQKKSPKPMV
jgi:hypothetical protein